MRVGLLRMNLLISLEDKAFVHKYTEKVTQQVLELHFLLSD